MIQTYFTDLSLPPGGDGQEEVSEPDQGGVQGGPHPRVRGRGGGGGGAGGRNK